MFFLQTTSIIHVNIFQRIINAIFNILPRKQLIVKPDY